MEACSFETRLDFDKEAGREVGRAASNALHKLFFQRDCKWECKTRRQTQTHKRQRQRQKDKDKDRCEGAASDALRKLFFQRDSK